MSAGRNWESDPLGLCVPKYPVTFFPCHVVPAQPDTRAWEYLSHRSRDIPGWQTRRSASGRAHRAVRGCERLTLGFVLPAQQLGLDLLDRLATQYGISLKVVVKADSLSLQTCIVEGGGMYALLVPYAIANAVREGRLQEAKIVDPTFYRYIGLAMSRHGDLTLASRSVMQLTKRLVPKKAAPYV